MEPKDLVPILGSRSRLFDELHIPMEALIPRGVTP